MLQAQGFSFINITITDFALCVKKMSYFLGYEEVNKKQKNNTTDEEELQRQSLSRTKRNIKELALCNSFTHFVTITINSQFCDRFSLQACQDKLKYIIKERIRRKNKDFAYLFITEKHKDGAFHFHGLIKNLNDLYTNENGYLSHKAFDEIGFNSFLKINTENNNSYDKVCSYITKYITKDCVKNENNQIYICSRGLKKATKYQIKNANFDEWSYENEFCKIKDIDLENGTLSYNDYYIMSHLED